jgi:predicted RNA binding protein YcfA (HicA-like mRNA interferase family)
MKLPRDLNGSQLVKMLERVDYQVQHQTGSHIIVRTTQNGENTQSVPNHKPLKIGTLNGILGEVADHLGMDKKGLTDLLFRKKR